MMRILSKIPHTYTHLPWASGARITHGGLSPVARHQSEHQLEETPRCLETGRFVRWCFREIQFEGTATVRLEASRVVER